MRKKQNKVPVSERALAARINRKLKHEKGELGVQLYKNRSRMMGKLGAYYVVYLRGPLRPDGSRKVEYIEHKIVDLESFAKKLGCLKLWEALQ
jgi:hypothetical protein